MNYGRIAAFGRASDRFYFILFHIISYIILSVCACLAALTYIMMIFSEVDNLVVITFNKVLICVHNFILSTFPNNIFKSYRIKIAESHVSAKPKFSMPGADLTNFLDLLLPQSITSAFLLLSAINITYATWDVSSLFVQKDPSEYIGSSDISNPVWHIIVLHNYIFSYVL